MCCLRKRAPTWKGTGSHDTLTAHTQAARRVGCQHCEGRRQAVEVAQGDDVKRPESSPNKTYIGDGVYTDFDGYYLVLTTENGIEVTNQIALEPQVIEALLARIASLKAQGAI